MIAPATRNRLYSDVHEAISRAYHAVQRGDHGEAFRALTDAQQAVRQFGAYTRKVEAGAEAALEISAEQAAWIDDLLHNMRSADPEWAELVLSLSERITVSDTQQ